MEELFETKQELARGHQGVVKLCTHKLTGQDFACKSTFPPASASPSVHDAAAAARDPLAHARFEALTLSNLPAHPNIVSLITSFDSPSGFHLILQLCRGGDLLDHLIRLQSQTHADDHQSSLASPNWPITESHAAEIFASALRAVAFCHDHGIVHRDIKIENLLLPHEGCSFSDIKLADFGYAAEFRTAAGQRRAVREGQGTLPYMAPEMFRQKVYDEKVDIWSLGVVLFFLLCGNFPFDGKTPQEILKAMDVLKYPKWEEAIESPLASPLAKDLLKKMLVVNPLVRYPAFMLLSHPWLQKHQVAGQGSTSCKIEKPKLYVRSIQGDEEGMAHAHGKNSSPSAPTCSTFG